MNIKNRLIEMMQMCQLMALISVTKAQDDQFMQIKRLRKELLEVRAYDKWSRPVKQHQTPTRLNMSIYVTHLTDLNVYNHILTMEAWLRMTWLDEHLTWNPTDFGGLQEINFSSDEIWRPDITLWNSADHLNLDQSLAKVHFIVSSNGTVLWTPVGTLRTFCNVDLQLFPYDTQSCHMYFGSWSHTQDQINITTSGNDFLESMPWYTNPEWQILKMKSTRNDYESSRFGVFTSLDIIIQLKRSTSYYYYTVTLPSICSILLVLAIFWLPSHSSVRFTLGSISLFVSLSTLLFLGLQLGMASVAVPIAVQNLSASVIMIGTALILSSLSQHIAAFCLNSGFRVPEAVIKVLSGVVANVFCLNESVIDDKQFGGDRMQLTPEDESTDPRGSGSELIIIENQWRMIFVLVDRLFFAIYSIIFVTKKF